MKLLKFNQFILEKIDFAFAVNQDLPASFYNGMANNTIITDEEDEGEYPESIKGKTHGSISHAIKHLKTMDNEFFKKMITRAYTYLKEYYDDGGFLGIINRQGDIIDTDNSAKRRMGLDEIMNMLDFINDKKIIGEELREEENYIFMNVMIPMRRRYEQIIEDIIENSEYCTEERILKNENIFFDVIEKGNKEIRIFYDINNKFIVLKNNIFDKIITSFFLKKGNDSLSKRINNKWLVSDQNTKRLILKYNL